MNPLPPRKWANATALAACLLVATLLPGCTSSLLGNQPQEPKPMEYTYILIAQKQYAGPLPVIYMGSIDFPHCMANPNDFTVKVNNGYEVYHIQNPNINPKMVIVEKFERTGLFNPDTILLPITMNHHILYNETIEGASNQYAIHFWHQVIEPVAIPRVDYWFNVTFTPYASQTFHEEGERC